MKTLYLECNMGAAGDMLMAALLELHPDKDGFLARFNHVGIPGVRAEAVPERKCGICGTRMKVEVDGCEEDEDSRGYRHDYDEYKAEGHRRHHHGQTSESAHDGHTHDEHTHGEHSHVHRSMQEINHIIDSLALSEEIKTDVRNVYQLIAEAEGEVHGRKVTEVHFHEVGMMDAIADITGTAMLIHELQIDKITVSPVHTGFGQVRCAHGVLPVPTPATALLLKGIPSLAGRIEGELCTPTGAALLQYYADDFGQMPPMRVEKIGYGMGKKDFEAANCIRAMLGDAEEQESRVIELCCNIDDMTPEEIGYAMELFMEEGARDVYTTAIGMKKGRPGILLTVMCMQDEKEKMAELIFRHTSTIGIRETSHDRIVLSRSESVKRTCYGEIRFKKSSGFGITKEKPEYEDIRKIAKETGLSLREIRENL
jgi:hypothetical protein